MRYLLYLIDVYELFLLLAGFLTWVSPKLPHTLVRFVRAITEPILAPLRKILPRMGEVDFSPVAAIMLLEILSYALLRIA